jgi:hypothetical protein
LQHVPQQRAKRYQHRHVGMSIGRQTNFGACRPIKHPRRNLQPTVRIGTGDIAPEHHAIRLVDRRMNRDPKPRPGMKAVEQLPKLSPVGVLKPCCTMRCGRIRAWGISRQMRSWLNKKTQRTIIQRAASVLY